MQDACTAKNRECSAENGGTASKTEEMAPKMEAYLHLLKRRENKPLPHNIDLIARYFASVPGMA
eukprot:376040-Rhodomonas_salina.2